MKILVVGAGFSGSVAAREIAETLVCAVTVIDERDHIAGNCHTSRDDPTGVMVHRYGPHIFNTDEQRVWDYVNRFVPFHPFVNRVKASIEQGIFSMPINLHTINQFFGMRMNPEEARLFVAAKADQNIGEPANFEEQALKFLGPDLYHAFFKGYTTKQWGVKPTELPASILKRLPVRFSYDDNYYNKKFQGIPHNGYTAVMEGILDHPSISVELGRKVTRREMQPFDHTIYTGSIDSFFDHQLGRLGYRTVTFERIETDAQDFQGNAVINYPGMEIPFTRIHEHKHFTPWETLERTVAFREYSKETAPGDVPYYPKRLEADKRLLGEYRKMAEETENVSFLGRLATYRYMDMERVIGEALDFSSAFVECKRRRIRPPVFPNQE